MNAERRMRIEALFDSALDRLPEKRVAWLAGECGEDPERRDEVVALLAAHDREQGI